MSTVPAPGPSFTDSDLSYVLAALQASRAARRAHGVVEAAAHGPRLREAARRGQIAHDDDITRIVSLLEEWHQPEVPAAGDLGAPTDLFETPAISISAADSGPARDQRLVTALSAHAEASVLRDRAEMIEGFDSAARDLAEDHIRAASREVNELQSVLERDHRS